MIDTTPYHGRAASALSEKDFKDLLIKICLGAVRKDLDRQDNQRYLPQNLRQRH